MIDWTLSDLEKAHGKKSGRAKKLIMMGWRPFGLRTDQGIMIVPAGTPWPNTGKNGRLKPWED